ncbi:Threonine/homoserine/homoserine lactone efflux protein [Ohtaekwangia koreensis]|uniref:Threonine/homoserine/homoserine lactone efflux protein n=2 Tax=Ohtaekwangia koreensis TaxID=688867 RepID=A0A1T5MEY8_9BACT|nr:Threonine/homoserine/homoserine lactone efflux protein [Ohtaekwangia koreensis]
MRSWKIGKRFCKITPMEIVLNGIISGIVLAFLIGPVFFTIIQTSIERGFTSGVFVAVGVSFSDALYIFVSYLGLVQFMETESFRHYLAYGGGIVLLLFGLYYLLIKSKKLVHYDPQKIEARSWWRLAAKGFIINGLSPMVLFFWIATVGVATTQLNYNTNREAFIFFSSIVGTVFITDTIKAKLADKLRLVMTPIVIRVMNIVLGIVLVIFAGRLILFPDNIPH